MKPSAMAGAAGVGRFASSADSQAHSEADKRLALNNDACVQCITVPLLTSQHKVARSKVCTQRVLPTTRPRKLLEQPGLRSAEWVRVDLARLHGGVDACILVRIANRNSDVSAVALDIFVPSDRIYRDLTSGEPYDEVRFCRDFHDRVKVAVRRILHLDVCVAAVNRHVDPGVAGCAAHGNPDVIVAGSLDFVPSAVQDKFAFASAD